MKIIQLLQTDTFQWLPLIFNDFSRQNAIFPGQHQIPWLFKARLKFHDFSRLVWTMYLYRRSCELTWSLVVTPHIQRIIAWSLHCWRCKSDEVGAQVSLHVAWRSWHTNFKHFICRWWEISGRWGPALAHWICPNATRHLVMEASTQPPSSPQGNRRMAPPQASLYPLWPLSLVCHLLVWSVQYTVYNRDFYLPKFQDMCRLKFW